MGEGQKSPVVHVASALLPFLTANASRLHEKFPWSSAGVHGGFRNVSVDKSKKYLYHSLSEQKITLSSVLVIQPVSGKIRLEIVDLSANPS